jgi:hypothetical protein
MTRMGERSRNEAVAYVSVKETIRITMLAERLLTIHGSIRA